MTDLEVLQAEIQQDRVPRTYECYEVAKDNIRIYVDQVPMAVCVVRAIQGVPLKTPSLCLLDSGSSHSWLKAKSLPKGCTPVKVEAAESQTLAGTLKSNLRVSMVDFALPEFFKTRRIAEAEARVFHGEC